MFTYFFMLSFSRSGSTVLGQKLNNHSNVTVINESWIFNLLGILGWKKLTPKKQRFLIHTLNKNKGEFDNKINLELVEPHTVSPKHFFERIFNCKTKYIGEKTPTNIFYFDYIKKRIKNARFIFLKRHPIAIASSYYKRWYSSSYTDEFLINVVSTIKAYYRNFEYIKDKSDILQLKYEDLVSNSKETLEYIASHIGFEFEEEMLEESKKELFLDKSVKQHHKDSSQKLNTDHLNKYLKTFSKQQISELNYLLRNEINAMSYNFDEEPVSNKRLIKLEEKIEAKISPFQVKKRKKIQKLKLQLSFIKFNLFH